MRRKLRSDSPILAELSGGLDSSSIVCIADDLIARGTAETSGSTPSLTTTTPNPTGTSVSTFRSRRKARPYRLPHRLSTQELFKFDSDRFSATPGSRVGAVSESSLQLGAYMTSKDIESSFRVSEVTKSPAAFRHRYRNSKIFSQVLGFDNLHDRLKVWAINKRKPWLYLFFETARSFAPSSCRHAETHASRTMAQPNFVKRNRTALQGYETRFKLFGSPPSFQENIFTLDGLRRQLTCDCPPQNPSMKSAIRILIENYLNSCMRSPESNSSAQGNAGP